MLFLGHFSLLKKATFYFEIIIDSQEVTKMEQKDLMYPLPSFLQWLHLT